MNNDLVKEEQNETEKNLEYTICNKIGEGAHGIIYRIKTDMLEKDREEYAIKVAKDSNNDEYKKYLNNEIDILAKINHENIIKVYDYKKNNYMVMDLYRKNGANLKIMTHEYVRFVGVSILKALYYLHVDKNIVYKDIKPENILLISQNNKINKVVLSDFGFAAPFTNLSINRISKVVQGTPKYASISCHMGKSVCFTDDIENLMYVLIYMLMGKLPWDALENSESGMSFKNDSILLYKKTIKTEELVDNHLFASVYDYIVKINKNVNSYVRINSNKEELRKVYKHINKMLSSAYDFQIEPLSSHPLESAKIEITPTNENDQIRPYTFMNKLKSFIRRILCCSNSL